MKITVTAGAVSNIWQVLIENRTTGEGLTGLVFNTANLVAYYYRAGTVTTISLVTMTLGAYTSGGFKEIDAVKFPGLYEFCPPDAIVAAGVNAAQITLLGAANMVPRIIEVQLYTWDLMAAGVNVIKWLGTSVTLTSGLPDVNMKTITAGIIAAGSFAANALDAVWSTSARVLTAGTNIALAKGTGVTGFNDIAAADVWTVGTRTLTGFGSLVTDIITAISVAFGNGSYLRNTEPDNSGISSAASAASAAASSAASAASTSSTINTKIGTPAVSVAADIAAKPTAVQNADAWKARNQKLAQDGPAGQTLGDSAAGGLFVFSIVAGVITIKNADGTTAFTRTLTREDLDAIASSV